MTIASDCSDGELSLIFLHYWGGSSRTLAKVDAALPKSYWCLAIDHRRWDDSNAPIRGYALADMAADAYGVIETLDLKRYVLVGSSMGGKVVRLMASRRPKGVVGLVLVAPSPLSRWRCLPKHGRRGSASMRRARASPR